MRHPLKVSAAWLLLSTLLGSCASDHHPPSASVNPATARERIARALPRSATDRTGWTTDIAAAFTALDIPPSNENVCAVVAVIAQESGFHVDPVIPNLPAIAWREIDQRAAHAGVPRVLLHEVLKLTSPNGASYAERIDHARTERDLSAVYEDFIGTVPLGRTLFADRDPIRTRGPMQVQVTFAERFAKSRPYPYPVRSSIADEVFTRRGGVYFGIAHLLAYPADYDAYVYRFADFNAGQYASRNAAFQRAVTRVTGIPLVPDGALLGRDGEAASGTPSGATAAAVATLAARLDLDAGAIHDALAEFRSADFERTSLYLRIFGLADKAQGHALPRAVIPQIDLHGPKITRRITTEWYAKRVDGRYESCLNGT